MQLKFIVGCRPGLTNRESTGLCDAQCLQFDICKVSLSFLDEVANMLGIFKTFVLVKDLCAHSCQFYAEVLYPCMYVCMYSYQPESYLDFLSLL